VVDAQVDSLSVSAEEGPSIPNVGANQFFADNKSDDCSRATSIGLFRVSCLVALVANFESFGDAVGDCLIEVLALPQSFDFVQELVFQAVVQVLAQVNSTLRSSVAVEHGVVGYWHLLVDLQVLENLVSILHALSLPDVADNACVEPFYYKLQLPNLESVSRLQHFLFVQKQLLVHSAAFSFVKTQVY
jgi:hypothetical protein